MYLQKDKKKMKKKLIILFLLFLTSGCSVKENIIINKDLSVNEEVSMSGTKSFFDNRYMVLPINVIKEVLTSFDRENNLIQNGYMYDIYEDERYPRVLAQKKYDSISSFTEQTIFKNQYYEYLKTNIDGNLISIKSSEFTNYEDGDIYKYSIKSCIINIKLPFKVISSNADKIDKKTNTYTWLINEKTTDKIIDITFDKSRIYVYNLSRYIVIFLVILFVIIGYLVLKYLKNRNKKNNTLGDD